MPQAAYKGTIKRAPQLLSNEVHEIINYSPHWFIRRGNLIFLLLIMILLLLAFIIKYPDIIKGSVRLVALDAPKMLESKTDGKLEKLLIKNGQDVKKGQPMAYLQSTGSHEQMLSLKKWITEAEQQLETGKLEKIISNPFPLLTELGEIQTVYQDFQSIFKETQQILADGYYQKKKKALEKDLYYLSDLKNNSYRQQQLIVQDQDLQKKEYEAYEKLAKDKVIAPLELDQYKSKLIAKEQNLSQTQSQITNSDINSHNKRKELLELEKNVLDQQQKFQSSLYILKNQVEEWVQRYIISASENGRSEFISFLQENQLVNAGQQLFFIQPPQTNYYAEMKVGQSGVGKIKNGQKVILKLLSYPSSEFGYIQGSVSFISNLANARDSFMVKVDLSNGLRTNYNKTIFFRNNLSATAEVITDNRMLIDRLLGQLQHLTGQ